MTVEQLIELLQNQNPDLEVLLASDEEGNSFSPLCRKCLGTGLYDKASGDTYAPDDDVDGLDVVKALIIFPAH